MDKEHQTTVNWTTKYLSIFDNSIPWYWYTFSIVSTMSDNVGRAVRAANRSTRLQGGNIVRPQLRAVSRHRCTVEVRSEDVGEERSGLSYRVLSVTQTVTRRFLRLIESNESLLSNPNSLYSYKIRTWST